LRGHFPSGHWQPQEQLFEQFPPQEHSVAKTDFIEHDLQPGSHRATIEPSGFH
jgi:hypothetical protein